MRSASPGGAGPPGAAPPLTTRLKRLYLPFSAYVSFCLRTKQIKSPSSRLHQFWMGVCEHRKARVIYVAIRSHSGGVWWLRPPPRQAAPVLEGIGPR